MKNRIGDIIHDYILSPQSFGEKYVFPIFGQRNDPDRVLLTWEEANIIDVICSSLTERFSKEDCGCDHISEEY